TDTGTTGHRSGHGRGTGLDTIRNPLMRRSGERGHTIDRDSRGASAMDLGAHGVEAFGKIDHLRLTRRVFKDRLTVCKARSHHQDVRCAYRNLRKSVTRANQALRRPGANITLLNLDLRAQRSESFDEQVNRSGSD